MSSIAFSTAFAPALVATPQPEPVPELRECRRRALVVDDNPDITELLAVVLRQSGYEVSAANSASNALADALTKKYDVVIADIGMPGMTGYELARALRSVPEYGATLMVAMTGYTMYDDRERALEAGFDAHLSKPVDIMSLRQVISRAVH